MDTGTRMPSRRPLVAAMTSALLTVAVPAGAGTLNYTLYAGVSHSDNIALSSDRKISDSVLTPGGTFQFNQSGSTFQANVAGTVEYRRYLPERFDAQTQTELAAMANWTLVPERLDMSVEDYAGVQPVDQLASDSPDNQQQTNVLVVGPTLRMRFGDALRAQFEARYIDSYASRVDDFDSGRALVAVRAFRDLNATDQLSANGEWQHVRFRHQPDDADYDRKEAFLRYTSTLARFDADVLAGATRLDFHGGRDASAPLVRLRLGWQPSTRQALTFGGTYQYADAATDIMTSPSLYGPGTERGAQAQSVDPFANVGVLGGGASLSGVGVGNAVIGSDVYKERRADLAWSWRGPRLGLTVSPSWSRLRYLDDRTFDQTGKDLSIGVSYRVTPTTTLSGFATAERLTYDTLHRHDRTVRLGLDLGQQWNPHWSWHVSVARDRRTSDAAGQSYRANQIFVGFVYRR